MHTASPKPLSMGRCASSTVYLPSSNLCIPIRRRFYLTLISTVLVTLMWSRQSLLR